MKKNNPSVCVCTQDFALATKLFRALHEQDKPHMQHCSV